MTIKAFKKPGQLTVEGVALAQEVDNYTRQLTNNPLLGGITQKQVSVVSGDNDIAHALGTSWQGWAVTRTNAAITLYESTTQTNNRKYLTLTASGAGVIDVYIF